MKHNTLIRFPIIRCCKKAKRLPLMQLFYGHLAEITTKKKKQK